MYYNHNLRTNLQEWRNRLSKANYQQFGLQLKFLLNNIEGNSQLLGLLKEVCLKYPFDRNYFDSLDHNWGYSLHKIFENEMHHAAFCYQFMNYLICQDDNLKNYELHRFTMFQGNNFEETKGRTIDLLIVPIINFFHDKLEISNSTTYLLEKYKKRTEWFTKDELLKRYKEASKNYEQIFEDDLRMFLFDQGIDYPFSTPKSSTGRADIVGAIDSSNPIIIEAKIFDKEKSYGKNRIKDGYTQIVNYTNDYNKDYGYLVIFNLDKSEINFSFKDASNLFPPMLHSNNKTYFFIVVNLNTNEAASKQGTLEVITITGDELVINS